MKTSIFALGILLLTLTTETVEAAPVTLAVQGSTPELFGIEGSIWVLPELTVDIRGTLATADAGVSGHIPFAGDWDGGRHDIVVTGLGGYVHGLTTVADWLPYHGVRFEGLAGYGYVRSFEVRVLAGFTAQQVGDGRWGTGFAAQLLLGKVF